MMPSFIAAAAVFIAVSIVPGFWPEYRQAAQRRAQASAARIELAQAEVRLRLAFLLGDLLQLGDAAVTPNVGTASADATACFNAVRSESSRTEQPDVRNSLNDILKTRDGVTTQLPRSDVALSQVLRQQELILRRAHRYPIDSEPANR
jgi:hypothetical protein